MNWMPAPTLISFKEQELTPINRFQDSQNRVEKYFTLTIETRNWHLQAQTTVFTDHKNDDGSDAHKLANQFSNSP